MVFEPTSCNKYTCLILQRQKCKIFHNIFRIMEYSISIYGKQLVHSRYHTARRLTASFKDYGSHIFSMLEDYDLLSYSIRKIPSCSFISDFFIILRKTHEDFRPLHICFIRRNRLTAAKEFSWIRKNNYTCSIFSCYISMMCRDLMLVHNSPPFNPKNNANTYAL